VSCWHLSSGTLRHSVSSPATRIPWDGYDSALIDNSILLLTTAGFFGAVQIHIAQSNGSKCAPTLSLLEASPPLSRAATQHLATPAGSPSGFRMQNLEHRRLRDKSSVRHHPTCCQNPGLLRCPNTATGGGMRRRRIQISSSRSIVTGSRADGVHIGESRIQLQQQAWSSGYDFCLTTQVFGYTEGSEFDSQGL
jgi:hypothetical protein